MLTRHCELASVKKIPNWWSTNHDQTAKTPKQIKWSQCHNNQSSLIPKHFLRKVDLLMKKGHKIHRPIVNGRDATPFQKWDVAFSGITRPVAMLRKDWLIGWFSSHWCPEGNNHWSRPIAPFCWVHNLTLNMRLQFWRNFKCILCQTPHACALLPSGLTSGLPRSTSFYASVLQGPALILF